MSGGLYIAACTECGHVALPHVRRCPLCFGGMVLRLAKTNGKVLASAQEVGGRHFCAAEFEDGIVLFCELDGAADKGDAVILTKVKQDEGSYSFFVNVAASADSVNT